MTGLRSSETRIALKRVGIAAFLAASLILAGCTDEVTFPSMPPAGYRGAPSIRRYQQVREDQLRKIAGAGALNCGVARDRASADRMTICATRALKMRRAFYCRYEPPADIRVDVSPGRIGGYWASPAAYVGTRDGALLGVLRTRDRGVSTHTVLSPDDRDRKPRHFHVGMTPPRVKIAPPPIDSGKRMISGIVIVEAIIDESGAVEDVRMMKMLPLGVDKIAEDIVRRTTFEPARMFGVALPVMYNITVNVDDGVVGLPDTRK